MLSTYKNTKCDFFPEKPWWAKHKPTGIEKQEATKTIYTAAVLFETKVHLLLLGQIRACYTYVCGNISKGIFERILTRSVLLF